MGWGWGGGGGAGQQSLNTRFNSQLHARSRSDNHSRAGVRAAPDRITGAEPARSDSRSGLELLQELW